MSKRRFAELAAISVLILSSGAAYAKNNSASPQQNQSPLQAAVAAQAKEKKTDVGPRDGFPDSPGLEVARDRANDNAAFKRYDSPGT